MAGRNSGGLARCFSRTNFYISAIIWGAMVIALSGLASASFHSAPMAIRITENSDALYHYHVSAVMTTLISFILFCVFSATGLKDARHIPLRESHRGLTITDIISLVGGVGIAFGMGWLKEIFDALSGTFADQADIQADVEGIFAQVSIAFVLLLPPHVMVAIYGDPIRYWLLKRFVPKDSRKKLEKASNISRDLTRNRKDSEDHNRRLQQLENEIASLESDLHKMPAAMRKAPEGQKLLGRIRKREEESQGVRNRLQELEFENARLRSELRILKDSAKDDPAAALIGSEVQALCAIGERDATKLAMQIKRVDLAIEKAQATVVGDEEKSEAPAAVIETLYDNQTAGSAAEDTSSLREELEATWKKLVESENDAGALNRECENLNREIAGLKTRIDELSAASSANSGDDLGALEEAVACLKRRVLIVDDDKAICRVYAAFLNNTGLVEARWASSAIVAIDEMRSASRLPDLIMLDIKMPGLTGTEFLSAMERNPRMRRVPVVLCSGSPRDSVEGLDHLNPVAYLQKPVSSSDLQNTVLSALGIAASP